MGLPITVTFANPDPGILFTTQQAEVDMLNSLVTAETDDDVTPYIVSSSTPGVDDQDKVWHRLNANGAPLGTYVFYNGIWVKEYPNVGGRISFFSGDPTAWFDANGLGLRTIAGNIMADYYGWQIANGQNGTANLSDQFIIGARMDNSGITGYDTVTDLWRTNIRGLAETQGGVPTITLDQYNTYRPAVGAKSVGLFDATDLARQDSGQLYGTVNDPSNPQTVFTEADLGNTSPPEISVVNPFYAMAIIAWVDYDTYY